MSISLGWQEQAPLLFNNFMIRHLVFFLFIKKNLYVYKHSALHFWCLWRLLDFLGWKLQLLSVIWEMGIEPESFGRRASMPNC